MQIEAIGGSIGQSFDLLKGEIGNKIFDPGDPQKYWRNTESRVVYELHLIETQKALTELMSFSASASFSGILGNGGMRAEAIRSITTDELSLSLVVSVKVELESRGPVDCIMLEDATLELQEQQDLTAFVATYGTGIITSETLGGQLLAIAQILTRSATEKNELKASLGGTLGTFSSHAEFADALTKTLKEKHISRYVNRSGVDGQVPRLEDLVEYSENFPITVRNANQITPRVAFLGYQDYTRLKIQGEDSNRLKIRLLDLEHTINKKEEILKELLTKRSEAKIVFDTTTRILADPTLPFDRNDALLKQTEASNAISTADSIAREISNYPTHPVSVPIISIPVYRPIDSSPPVIPLIYRLQTPAVEINEMGDWLNFNIVAKGFSIELGPVYMIQGLGIKYDFKGTKNGGAISSGKNGEVVALPANNIAISLYGDIAYKYSVKYEVKVDVDSGDILTGLTTSEGIFAGRNGSFAGQGNGGRPIKGIRVWIERRAP